MLRVRRRMQAVCQTRVSDLKLETVASTAEVRSCAGRLGGGRVWRRTGRPFLVRDISSRRGLRVGFAAAVRGQPAVTTGSTENRASNVALRDNQSIKKRTRLVSPNFTADLAVVDGNPLSDIEVAIHHVIWVMKSGAAVVDKTSPTPH